MEKLSVYSHINILKDEKIQPYNIDQTKKFFMSPSYKDKSSKGFTKHIKLEHSSSFKSKSSISQNEKFSFIQGQLSDNDNHEDDNILDKNSIEKKPNLPYILPKHTSIKFSNTLGGGRSLASKKNPPYIETLDKQPLSSKHANNNNSSMLEISLGSAKSIGDYNNNNQISNRHHIDKKDKKDEMEIIKEKIKEFQNLNLSERSTYKTMELTSKISTNTFKKTKDFLSRFQNNLSTSFLLDPKIHSKKMGITDNINHEYSTSMNFKNTIENFQQGNDQDKIDSSHNIPSSIHLIQKSTLGRFNSLENLTLSENFMTMKKDKEDQLFNNNVRNNKFFNPKISPTKLNNELYLQIQENLNSIQTPLHKIFPNAILAKDHNTNGSYNNNNNNNNNSMDASPESKTNNLSKTKHMSITNALSDDIQLTPFMQSLRKELPYLFKNKPCGRQEVINLGSWLCKILNEINENNTLSNIEKYSHADEVYNICLNELLRQTSFECIERSELMKKIWRSYINLILDIIDDVKKTKEFVEKQYEKEYNLQHNTYERIFKKKDEKISELAATIEKLQTDNQTLKDQNHDITQKELGYKAEIAKLKNLIMNIKKNFQILRSENTSLLFKFEKLKESFNMTIDDDINEDEFTRKRRLSIGEYRINKVEEDEIDDEEFGSPKNAKQNFGVKIATGFQYEDIKVNAEIQTDILTYEENEAQSTLELVDSRYDRIFCNMKKIDSILEEDALKQKIVQEVEMIENLAEYDKEDANHETESRRKKRRHGKKSKNNLIQNNSIEGYDKEADLNIQNQEDIGNIDNEYEGEDEEEDMIKYSSLPTQKAFQEDKINNKITNLEKDNQNDNKTKGESIVNLDQNYKNNEKKGVISTEILKLPSRKQSQISNNTSSNSMNNVSQANLRSNSTKIDLNSGVKSMNESLVKTGEPKGKDLNQSEKLSVLPQQKSVDNISLNQLQESAKIDTKKDTSPDMSSLNQIPKNQTIDKDKTGVDLSKKAENSSKPNPPQQVQSNTTSKKTTSISTNANKSSSIMTNDMQKPNHADTTGKVNPQAKELKKQGEKSTGKDNKKKSDAEKNPISINPQQQHQEKPIKIPKISNEAIQAATSFANDSSKSLPNTDKKLNLSKQESIMTILQEDTKSDDQSKHNMESLTTIKQINKPFSNRSKNSNKISNIDRLKRHLEKTKLGEQEKSKNEILLINDTASVRSQRSSNISAGVSSDESHDEPIKSRFVKEKTIDSSYAEEEPDRRLITMMNMYKVEKQKYDNLSNLNSELEAHLVNDNQLVQQLKDLIFKLQNDLSISLDKIHELEEFIKLLEVRNESLKRLQDLKMKTIIKYDNQQGNNNTNNKYDSELQYYNFNNEMLYEEKFLKRNESKIMNRREYIKNFLLNVGKKIIQEKKSHAASNLIAKIRKQDIDKINEVIALKPVIKQIAQFYNEKIILSKENALFKDQDMGVFIYKLFLNTYGFRNFAEKKFTKFCLSIRKFMYISRIGKFARLCGLSEPILNYSTDEQQVYMNALDFLQNSSIGGYIENNDIKKNYIPFSRGIEYARLFTEKRVTVDEFSDIRKDLEKLKENDMNSSANKVSIVDIDIFIDRLISKYKIMIARYKEILQPILIAADINNANRIHYIEFSLLYKHIESDKYDPKKCEDIFANQSDIVENEDCWFSYDKFIAMSFEYDFFSIQKQNKFLGLNNNDELFKKYEELKINWIEQKETISTALNQSNDLDEMMYQSLYNICENFDILFGENDMNIYKIKGLIIRFKIMNYELKLNQDS